MSEPKSISMVVENSGDGECFHWGLWQEFTKEDEEEVRCDYEDGVEGNVEDIIEQEKSWRMRDNLCIDPFTLTRFLGAPWEGKYKLTVTVEKINE